MTKETILPEERLGVCLYILGRGDYYYTIAEMVRRGVATVSSIVQRGFSSSSSKTEHLMQKVLVQLKQIHFAGAKQEPHIEPPLFLLQIYRQKSSACCAHVL